MATIAAPKRSARLKSRDDTTKVLQQTQESLPKRKSKKIAAVNKSKQKVNINARRLRPRQGKKYHHCSCSDDSQLLQKHVPKQQHDSVVMLEKIDLDKKVPIYKTLKSEKSLEKESDIYDFKFDINDTKEKLKKRKRGPRKKTSNKSGSKAIKKSRAKKKMGLSKMETIDLMKESELKAMEDARAIKIEAPEAVADVRTVKQSVKEDLERAETSRIDNDEIIIKETIGEEDVAEATETSRIEIDIRAAEELVQPETETETETLKVDSVIQDTGAKIIEETAGNQNRKLDMRKPKIVSIENADNIVVTKPGNTEDLALRPFRAQNIFDNKTSNGQSTNTLNSTALTKSLSPIIKASNNVDLGSPWRSPMFSFSQVKHFVQSTPNARTEINNENAEENKENRCEKPKGKKQKTDKKHMTAKQYGVPKRNPKKIQTVLTSRAVEQVAPCRISLGELRTLQNQVAKKPENEEATNETRAEADKSLETEKDKQLTDYLNFSDTFDVMSETERMSNLGVDIPLFVDLEPSHFSKVRIAEILYVCLASLFNMYLAYPQLKLF